MTVESASFISQLVTANPAASDNISEGDDHIRLVKSVLKSQFPNLATIGTTFGTSGSDFKVPDFRSFLPIGVGGSNSLGTSQSAVAGSGSAVVAQIPINFLIKT